MNFKNYHKLTINGSTLSGDEMIHFCQSHELENVRLLGDFLKEWLNSSPFTEVRTSGSTGIPKIISVRKSNMLESAARTLAYFRLNPGDTALLPLSMKYIAGKMMVVRALLGGLKLIIISPNNQPFENISKNLKIDFVPLVPSQLLDNEQPSQVQKILLGGGVISPKLEEKLQSFSTAVYHGYGMTETLSHVAVRKVNGKGKSRSYLALAGIHFETDHRDCLKIHVPFLEKPVQTNDVVQLIDASEFIWKGRADFVINSGGIKFSPEEIEKKISPFLENDFFIAGIPDQKWGQKLSLFIESQPMDKLSKNRLVQQLNTVLGKYEKLREVFFVNPFERTISGKIQRENTLKKGLLSLKHK